MTFSEKAEKIKALVFDVDGTLTDGRIGYGCGSDYSIKFFYCKDGLGLNLARMAGYKICVLTGRADPANRRRCQDLKMDLVQEDCLDKEEGLRIICQKLGIEPAECCYMGDDLNDLPAMRVAGMSAAPADSSPEVLACVDFVAAERGGHGAVRNMVEKLLKCTGKWNGVLQRYTGGNC